MIHRIKISFPRLLFCLSLLVAILVAESVHAQNVTPASGGESISADSVNGTFTTLGDIIIDETSPGQISVGNLIFKLPEGFEWDTGTTPTVTIETATGFKGNKATSLEIDVVGYNSPREMVFDVIQSSDQASNKPGKATFGGLKVRPTTSSLPNNGDISVDGAALSINENFGDLKMVAGAPEDVFIETAADGTGSQVTARNLTAGNSLTVYAISRDQGGNFIKNIAADSWSLNNKSGLTATPLTPASDSKSANFSSTITGSATISASKSGLTSNPSGTITVVAASSKVLEIQTQPSASNTAGTPFSTQPQLRIKDQYGNTVTSNSYSTVIATRLTGKGSLKGQTSVTASEGMVTFSDLYHTVANDISIRFSATDLHADTSQTITITPASADSLTFAVQPTFGEPNVALSPDPEVQVMDSYGNSVAQQNIDVTLQKMTGSGNIGGSTTVSTNTNGIAVFDNITFDQSDTYTIKATNSSLKNSETSDSFTIASAGSLAGFKVTSTDDTNIGTQSAGTDFAIKLTAVDGAGDLVDTFDGNVNLTTNNDFADAIDTTSIGPFNSGVYSSHTVNLIRSGNANITATNESGSESGTSNSFTVEPGSVFPDSTVLRIPNTTLTANGSDTTRITAILKDELGNKLTTGGDNVSINLSGSGSVSATSDNGDGTYSAIVTAPSSVGSATISADVNGTSANVSKTINFEAGALSTFRLEDAGTTSGTISNQIAGSSFDVKITAKDAYGNTITTFDDNVTISSDATFESGNGTTAAFVNGVLDSHSITLTSAGDFSIRAERTGYSESGESNIFTVSPASADRVTSTVTSGSSFLENNGSDNTTISVQLKDAYGNLLNSQDGNSVYLFFENTSSASLPTNGETTYQGDGLFTGTLTAGTNIETANIIATLNNSTGSTSSSDIDTVTVEITQFNTWTSSKGGNLSAQRQWGDDSNWNLNIPSTNQVIRIPTTPTNEKVYPTINQNETIDFLDVSSNATVNLEPGYTFTVNKDMSGEGTFICDRSDVTIYRDLTIATFAASTCNLTLTGSGSAQLSNYALASNVTIDRDVTLTGSLQSLDTLTVTSGNTLTIEDGATLDIQGDLQIDGQLNFNGGKLYIGDDFNNPNIDISNTAVEFDGTTAQDITGLDNFSNLIINNPQGVTFHNDVVVQDTLILTDGVLTINSGYSLVTTEKSGSLSNIRMLREISGQPGWRMLSPPLASSYDDMLDSTVTQGYANSSLGLTKSNGDSLQPNVLFYDESFSGTDNERWRHPSDATNTPKPGRGLFVYFFGEVNGDTLYNNPLPDSLTIKGAEHAGDGTSFTFPVTYTASADTGWNLVGNPFAATIDWDDGSWVKDNIDNVVYIWDPSTKDYKEYNGIDGDPALDDGLIMPFQGFWVKANGNGTPVLKVNETSKTTGGQFFNKSKKKPASIEFLLEKDSLKKTSHLTLSPDGKNSKDRRDAFRLLPFETNTYLELYFTLEDGTQLSINNLARSFGKELSIPIYVGGFKNGNPLTGEFTLSWPDMGKVPDAWTMILEDRQTGKKIDLRKNTFYSFDISQTKGKTAVNNTIRNFRLTEQPDSLSSSKSRAKSSRFVLRIEPGADASDIPDEYALGINYPNPFRESTTIKYQTPLEGNVQILIYDILGRRVKTLLNTNMKADYHKLKWSPTQLASGIYIVVMRAGDKQFSKKITYIK